MSISNLMGSFVNGVKSVMDVPAMAKDALSSSIADGISAGIARALAPLSRLLMAAGLAALGIFFVSFGIGGALENFLRVTGAGYALVGVLLLAAAYGSKPSTSSFSRS